MPASRQPRVVPRASLHTHTPHSITQHTPASCPAPTWSMPLARLSSTRRLLDLAPASCAFTSATRALKAAAAAAGVPAGGADG